MNEKEYDGETRIVETVQKFVVREHGKLVELWLDGNTSNVPDKVMFVKKGVVIVRKVVELGG